MEYAYTETYGVKISVKMTLNQLEDLRSLAVKLLGDSDEAQAARTLVGMDSWDLRKLRDQANAALGSCAEAMKYEGLRLESKVQGDK